jgi:hypothetical protein
LKRDRRPTLRRIIIELMLLVLLHFFAVQALARVRLLEHLLSPGPESRFAIGVTVAFLLLRGVLLLLAPGWFAARIWLWWTRPRSNNVA